MVSFANVHEDHNVHTYNYTLRQRRSDETLRGSERHKVFVQAVVEGQLPRVRNFLRMGVDLDETGTTDLTILHRAVLSGHEDVIEPLIEAGADVNAVSDDFGTPLCLAALKGMASTVVLLLKYKARPSIVSEALGTALHCCILSLGDHRDSVVALMSAGAPVSVLVTLDTRWLCALCSWDGDDRNQMIPIEWIDGFRLQDVTPALLAIRTLQGNLLEPLLPSYLNTVSRFHKFLTCAEKGGTCTNEHMREIYFSDGEQEKSAFWHSYLGSCAAIGNLDGATLLIAKGANVDPDHETGLTTPLISAVLGKSKEIVTLLLDNGASINRRDDAGMTALHHAACHGENHIVRLLCERGATVGTANNGGSTPVRSFACASRNSRDDDFLLTLRTLIDAGADVNAVDEVDDGFTPLLAMLRGTLPINTVNLETLVRSGARPNIRASDGTSTFCLCVARSNAPTLLAAIGRGLRFEETVVTSVNLELLRKRYEDGDYLGQRMIYLSAKASSQDLAFVLSMGIDINIKGPATTDWTAMHCAAHNGSFATIERLLAAGASLEPYNDRGRTPLTLAVHNNHIRAVEVLLSHGCDPHAKGSRRCAQSAIEAAQRSGGEVLSLVEKAAGTSSVSIYEVLAPIGGNLPNDSSKSQPPLWI